MLQRNFGDLLGARKVDRSCLKKALGPQPKARRDAPNRSFAGKGDAGRGAAAGGTEASSWALKRVPFKGFLLKGSIRDL